MREKTYHVYLDSNERKVLIHSLSERPTIEYIYYPSMIPDKDKTQIVL